MISQVVVPLDGSSLAATAIAPGEALAEATGAELTLMTAEPLTTWHEHTDRAYSYLAEQSAARGYRRVMVRVVEDQPRRDAILAENRVAGAVVCMATHGRGGLGQAMLGSTAEAVVRASERPLLLVGPNVAQPLRAVRHGNLVVTIDGSDAAESILPTVSDWVQLLAMRPWVVEVLAPPSGTETEADPAAESALVRHLAHDLPDDERRHPEWEVLHGTEAADAIVHYARDLPTALIAMATHGRTGLARVALGSVALRVVHGSPCPVLIQRAPRLD
jgi:nucleotide-binding universal stress UspA family protein